jgi:hypothetical protein
MKLSEFKSKLGSTPTVIFKLPNGSVIPSHFHVTEVGQITKHFIDCGGTIRNEQVVNFQLFQAGDTDHRLAPQKLMKIIDLSEKSLNLSDGEIEVEYQDTTIGKYGIEYKEGAFYLTIKNTACLASDNCGIQQDKQKKNLPELTNSNRSCCTPGGGCC